MTKRKSTALYCSADEDRTKQSFREECDMNHIVAKINQSKVVPLEAQAALRRQIYGDFTAAPGSLEEAYAIVQRADDVFNALPAKLRVRFGSPAGFLDFIEQPENITEAEDLGLLKKMQPVPVSAPNPAVSELPANPVPATAPAAGGEGAAQ